MCPYVFFYPSRFRVSVEGFFVWNANLMKVLEDANGLHKKPLQSPI